MTTFPLTTTLNRIWAIEPCDAGKARALQAAGKTGPDDALISYVQIVEAVGLNDALWCCRAEPQHGRLWRLFAVWCARRVQPADADPRSIAALDVAERHANGEASDGELAVARADAARADAWDAAERAAAWAAAWDAAWAAADAAADAADADAQERAAQRAAFLQLVTTGTLPEP